MKNPILHLQGTDLHTLHRRDIHRLPGRRHRLLDIRDTHRRRVLLLLTKGTRVISQKDIHHRLLLRMDLLHHNSSTITTSTTVTTTTVVPLSYVAGMDLWPPFFLAMNFGFYFFLWRRRFCEFLYHFLSMVNFCPFLIASVRNSFSLNRWRNMEKSYCMYGHASLAFVCSCILRSYMLLLLSSFATTTYKYKRVLKSYHVDQYSYN